MRTGTVTAGKFRARAIAGTRAIMIALDCDDTARAGLLGFAFRRQRVGADPEPKWLRSLKVFKQVVPKPDLEKGDYRTNEFPIQSFLWSDYTAEPGTRYEFEIYPAYGQPGALTFATKLTLTVETEPEDDGQHGIWFNRGAIASQAYAREFKNHKPTDQEMNNPKDKHTVWLSRGLLEACLDFIKTTKKTEKLRACMYEFTYAPIIQAFKDRIDRGHDVKLIVHLDKGGKNKSSKNKKAMKDAGLDPDDYEDFIIWRTRPPIPHNKFIIKLARDGGNQVWTGSTNVTPSGFLGQSNVGHLVTDDAVADAYMDYWDIVSGNPTNAPAAKAVEIMSPYPPPLVGKGSKTCIFSPRRTASMLNWYADRMSDATSSIMFTAAFTVAKDFIEPLARNRDFLRFVLKEKPPTAEEREALKGDRDLQISYGAVLGALYTIKDGKLVARRNVKDFALDRWFLKEELTRDQGNIFFIHTKYLLIDPLSDAPLICTGSANFSENSLTANDENMILIRGSTRVADIYMTEFDRLFRHFYFRDVANEVAMKKKKTENDSKKDDSEKYYLDDKGIWTNSYFYPGGFKTRRREMFFNVPANNWTSAASTHPDKEPVRPKKKPKAKANGTTGAKKKKTVKKTVKKTLAKKKKKKKKKKL